MWKVSNNEISENIKFLFYPKERNYGGNTVKYHIPNVNPTQMECFIPRTKTLEQSKIIKSLPSFKRAFKKHR